MKKILILSDNVDTLEIIGQLLEFKGYSVILCKNLKEAFQKIASIPDAYLVDVLAGNPETYFVAKTLLMSLRAKNLKTENFCIFTDLPSPKDERLANELCIRILKKWEVNSKIFPDIN